jgi:hypothetical protein
VIGQRRAGARQPTASGNYPFRNHRWYGNATDTQTSSPTAARPTVTTPVIGGTAQEGQRPSASAGQTDNTVTYQWFSSANGYTAAIGSDASCQVKEGGDEGNQIEVVAIAITDNGVTRIGHQHGHRSSHGRCTDRDHGGDRRHRAGRTDADGLG